ncbi:hypothetical protein DB30_03358 [Enhygromyxa salina]|uniref:Uncharacterized protein n=1 Tax=Enhygromyxa salina TaxID=215803 RepID=A0A0C1ZIS7_9BACT|nr:hypothetical protein DB30_03358 [Enhygromyxa salina]
MQLLGLEGREPSLEAPSELDELGLALGREHEQRRTTQASRRGRAKLGHVLADHDVRVGASAAKARHAGDPRHGARDAVDGQRRSLPRLEALNHAQRGALEVDVGVELARVEARDDLAVLELEQDLGHRRDPGRALAVADVRLDRSDRAVVRGPTRVAKCLAETGDLDRIAERGPRAVGLEVAQRPRIDARARQRLDDHLALCDRGRDRVARGSSAVVERRPSDDPVDMVAVGERLGEGLEQDRAHALPGHIAVAAGAEAATAPVVGQELALTEHHVLVGVQAEVHAAGQRGLTLPAGDGLAGEVDRRQRRRAHRVHGHARPVEVVEVGHAVGDGRRAAPQRDLLSPPLGLGPEQRVLLVHDSDEHPDGAAERVAGVARVLERVVGTLEKNPLLGVEVLGLELGDLEEQRIKAIDLVEEPAPLAGRVALALGVALVVPAIGRDLADAVATSAEVGPERIEVGSLGVAAAKPDDRDLGP